MKHTIKSIILAACALCLFTLTNAQVIDFEDPRFKEGDTLFDQYSGGDCGVTFYLDSAYSNSHPVIAQVGDQGSSYFAFQGPDGTECGQALTDVDMPAPNQGVGCKFLTDDGNVNTTLNTVVVVWDDNTLACSGYLLDIDGDVPNNLYEIWTISAYDATGLLLASQTIDATDPGTGDGIATYWEFSGIGPIKSVSFVPSGGGSFGFGLALDNFSTCSLQEQTCCGSGTNYQKNSDFEGGLNYFNSTYDHQPTIAPNSLLPREYTLVDAAGAATINPYWVLNGATTCTAADSFMVVNGRTNLSGQKVIWRNSYTLEPDREWAFCVKFKNLPACAFDILPEVEIMAGSTILNTVTINTDAADPCDWMLVSTPFSTAGNSGNTAYTFKIRLKENKMGDGNDLAIDDVTMREEGPVAAPSTSFALSPSQIGPTNFSVEASHPAVDAGCSYAWSVCEIDSTLDCIAGTELTHSSWQNAPQDETFNGYEGTSTWHPNLPNGTFTYGKRYQFTYTAMCPCSGSVTESQILTAVPSAKMTAPTQGLSGELDQVQLYPNPAKGNVTIELPTATKTPLQLQVMNATGQVVLAKELAPGQQSWNVALPTLSEGVYLLQMQLNNTQRTEKLVVRH